MATVNSQNRVLSTTQDRLLPKVVDVVLNSNVFATRMLSGAKSWAGEQLKFPIKVSKNQTGQAFQGFDTFSTSATDNRLRLAFDPAFYQITVALPLDELSVNNVDSTRVINLMSIEMEGAAHDLADDIGTLFYAVQSGKNFIGLGTIVDDGTSAATYGGLTRANVGDGSVLDATVTASGGTLTLSAMSTLYTNVTSGSQKPTVGFCDESVFNLYEQLLQPQERYVKPAGDVKNGLVAGTGSLELFFKGFPILADEKATAQALFFVNENYLDWYGLPLAETEPVKFKTQTEGNDYGQPMGLGFSWGGWVKPTNAAAIVGHIYLGGNLISQNPKRHGKLTGITSV